MTDTFDIRIRDIGRRIGQLERARDGDTALRLECVRLAAGKVSHQDLLLTLADEIYRFVVDGKVPDDVIPCGTEDADAFTLKCEGE